MRVFLPLLVALLLFANATAQTATPSAITETLFFGSSGAQVTTLQKILNSDVQTRIAASGPGAPGFETDYFGSLTRAAVIRFQEKYASDILIPSDLSQGNGRVGAFTRAKLNAIALNPASATIPKATLGATSTSAVESSLQDFSVKDTERIDIYSGDKKLADVQQKLLSAINAMIAAGSASAMPTIALTDVPSVVIDTVSPQSGLPGTRMSITTKGASEQSSIYFGSNHIVRSVKRDSSGNLSFAIPSIPPGLYDLAIKSSDTISNTMMFVVVDPRNPSVTVQSISPSTVRFNDTITITGAGFVSKNNVVVTNYQKFVNVASSDGKTLSVVLAPENLREAARIGQGTRNIQLFVSVANENGLSAKKYFTMAL